MSTCNCCQNSDLTAQVRGVDLCDECTQFVKPLWDEINSLKPSSPSGSSSLVGLVNSREFYDLMQTYRHTPLLPPGGVVDAFEAVKSFIVEAAEAKVQELEREVARNPYSQCKNCKKWVHRDHCHWHCNPPFDTPVKDTHD